MSAPLDKEIKLKSHACIISPNLKESALRNSFPVGPHSHDFQDGCVSSLFRVNARHSPTDSSASKMQLVVLFALAPVLAAALQQSTFIRLSQAI